MGQRPWCPPGTLRSRAGPRVTIALQYSMASCAWCGSEFAASGRRIFCSGACRQASYRARLATGPPRGPAAKPAIVYECPSASSATSRPRAAANSATFSAAGLALGACAPTAQNLLHTWTLAPERPKPSPTSPAPRGLTRLCLPCSAWGLAPVFHGARDILSGKAVILHLKPGRRPCRLSRGALSVERDLAAQPLGEGASRLVQD